MPENPPEPGTPPASAPMAAKPPPVEAGDAAADGALAAPAVAPAADVAAPASGTANPAAEVPTAAAAPSPGADATEAASVAAPVVEAEPALEAAASTTQTVAQADAAIPLPAREPSLAETVAALAERFPALFTPQTPKPIKLRIQADIQQRAPGAFTKKQLSIFLHRHTTSTAYIRALLVATQRFDLDGEPAGEIAAEHREAALAELDRRRQIVMQRRAVERGPGGPHPQHAGGRPAGSSAAASAAPPSGAEGDATALPADAQPERRGPHGEGRPWPRERAVPREADRARPPAGAPRHPGRGDRPPGAPREGQPSGQPGDRRHARTDRPGDGPRNGPSQGPRNGPGHGSPNGPSGGRRDQPRHSPNEGARDAPRREFGRGPGAGPRERWREGPPMAPPADEAPQLPEDPARRERAVLLRSFEDSPLTAANFCALKGLAQPEFEAQIALARREREERMRAGGGGAR